MNRIFEASPHIRRYSPI
uniref:Uncharacterized protein n=1 Tax=Rhizophora mucronata TaxID=61149 RepID=A0A2P2QG37_RHIMU